MYNLQQIRDMLQGQYGLLDEGSTIFDIAGLQGTDIATGLSDMWNLGGLNVEGGLFGTFDKSSLDKLTQAHWSPYLKKYKNPLTADLLNKAKTTSAKKVAGGFADTSAYSDFTGHITDEYNRKMGDVLGDVSSKKAEVGKGFGDIFQNWDDIMLDLSS